MLLLQPKIIYYLILNLDQKVSKANNLLWKTLKNAIMGRFLRNGSSSDFENTHFRNYPTVPNWLNKYTENVFPENLGKS